MTAARRNAPRQPTSFVPLRDAQASTRAGTILAGHGEQAAEPRRGDAQPDAGPGSDSGAEHASRHVALACGQGCCSS